MSSDLTIDQHKGADHTQSIRPVQLFPDVNDEVIERLEALLKQAKSGEISSLAYAYVETKDRGIVYHWTGSIRNDTGQQMMSAITLLQHAYAQDRLSMSVEKEDPE